MASRVSKQLRVGSVVIGGGAPVVVQSMTTTDTRDVAATVGQIHELERAGCELIRVAVPNAAAAEALGAIRRSIAIPLVADIHFDYRLALRAISSGVDGLRLNPGNIRDAEKVKLVVRAARERMIPIRIGVNAGSLPPADLWRLEALPSEQASGPSRDVADRMVEVALAEIRLLEALDFDLIKVSLKAFDVPTTVEAYRRIADLIPYPLHLGITESGTTQTGAIRSAVGIGVLLYGGIGDTIRVSLADHPRQEVRVAFEILKSLNLRQRGPVLVACPSCGRADVNILALAHQVEERLLEIDAPIKVAVMGCEVNGPGESRDADVGVAGGVGWGTLFRHGKPVRRVPEPELLDALMTEIASLVSDGGDAAETGSS